MVNESQSVVGRGMAMDTAGVVLLVDDQPSLLKFAARLLESEGFSVVQASDGLDALAILKARPVDVIVADIVMPRMNGYQLFQRVIENPSWVSIPFIMLSSRDLDTDIQYGKEMGADDYLTKPFEPEDLIASVRGRIKRSRQVERAMQTSRQTEEPKVYEAGDLHIDLQQHSVAVAGEAIPLSVSEFKLLAYLAERPATAVPLSELAKATHHLDMDAVEAGALLRPLVRRLRRKLGFPAGSVGCIESVRGCGYKLVPFSQAEGAALDRGAI